MSLENDFLKALRVASDLLFRSGRAMRIRFVTACLLDFFVVSLSVAAPALLKHLIDALDAKHASSIVLWFAAGYGLVWAASELLLRVSAYVTTGVIEQAKREAIERLCINTVFTANTDKSEVSSGSFSAKMAQVAFSMPVFIDGVAWQVFPLIIRLILSVGVLITFAPLLYPIILLVTVVGFVSLSVLTFSKIGDRQKAENKAMQDASWKILDALKNKQVTIAHASEGVEMKHVDGALVESKRSALSTMAYTQFVSAAQVLVLGAGLTIVTMKGVLDVASGLLSMGEFVQLNAYVLQFVLPISYFGMVLSGIKRASVSLSENAGELVARDIPAPSAVASTVEPVGIRIKDVSVSFNDAPALENINISVRPGECVAIVGSSGAGKSTLAKAIVGLCEPVAGAIYLGDSLVSKDTIKSLRNNVGYVPQDPQLFDRSVYDNVFFDGQSAEFVGKVLRLSGLDVDSPLVRSGVTCSNLSGGEKQRVAFARAIARNPGILILDEPSSSLDAQTREIISSSLFDVFNTLTRVLITHDLKQASRADRLIVMRDGHVIEAGTHFELIQNNGWYSRHWIANGFDSDRPGV